MSLRIFPVAGEALNFGFRRMETIARVAILPAVLMMVLQLATVFSLLSVLAEQVFTFTDMTEMFGAAPSFIGAQQILANNLVRGWSVNPPLLSAIIAGSVFLHLALATSIIAPLSRYAATGEKPAPGLIRVAFGPNELRFLAASTLPILLMGFVLFAPAAAAAFYSVKYLTAALSQTIISFPNPESLHTVEVISAAEKLTSDGLAHIYNLGIPAIVAAPFAVLLFALLLQHFHPKNRPGELARGNWFLRSIVMAGATALLLGGAYLLLREGFLGYFGTLVKQQGITEEAVAVGPINVGVFLSVTILMLLAYLNLRFFPYPGVAVGKQSLGLSGVLNVTRGWGLPRLFGILVVLGAFWFLIQAVVLNYWLLGIILPSTVSLLYNVTAVSTRLVNSGVTGEWVLPVWIWIWSMTKIGINLLWWFFSYGVVAGLYGRLYRESQSVRE